MNRTCLISVATYSYLHSAFVMADSFAEHNSGCDIFLLVPDMSQAQIDSNNWPVNSSTRIIGIDELSNPLTASMRQYFNALEFCCALKAILMHHVLFVKGYDKALIIDPDVMCYASFDEVLLALKNVDIVLTPHVTSPFPNDGKAPDDLEYVTAGFVNGGFMAARKSQNTEVCLNWLINKISDFGFFAPRFNLFADQTWLTCMPWFFPENVLVKREAGLNVAYWNLYERILSTRGDNYFSNDQRLIFFHYSGFDYLHPMQLTVHFNRTFSPDTNAVLKILLGDYTSRLTLAKSQMPHLIADSPCTNLSLKKRLKLFKLLRGKAARYYGGNITASGRLSTLAHSVIRRLRNLISS